MSTTSYLPSGDEAKGYWGTVTATVDWCEENYVISYYVAEFWNTLTNIAYIIPSLFGAYSSWANGLETRFIVAYLSNALIGVGAALFHATLKRAAQILDEIPMLFAMAVLLHSAAYTSAKDSSKSNLATVVLTISTAFSLLYLMSRNSTIFFFLYISMVIILLGLLVLALRKCPSAWTFAQVSVWTFSLAFGIWNIENIFCRSMRRLRSVLGVTLGVLTQFHGWWHILTAISSYYLVVCLSQLRLATRKTNYRIEYRWKLVPVIEKDAEKLLAL